MKLCTKYREKLMPVPKLQLLSKTQMANRLFEEEF